MLFLTIAMQIVLLFSDSNQLLLKIPPDLTSDSYSYMFRTD